MLFVNNTLRLLLFLLRGKGVCPQTQRPRSSVATAGSVVRCCPNPCLCLSVALVPPSSASEGQDASYFVRCLLLPTPFVSPWVPGATASGPSICTVTYSLPQSVRGEDLRRLLGTVGVWWDVILGSCVPRTVGTYKPSWFAQAEAATSSSLNHSA